MMSAANPRRRNSLRTRLFLQPLEDRRTPATFTVDALTDTGAGAGLTGDLRYCIVAAGGLAGADTIVFDNALAGQTINVSAIGDGTAGPSAFGITDSVTIVGLSGNSGVTISGGGASSILRAFYVAGTGSLSLQDLTISNFRHKGGDAGGGGGGAGMGGAIFVDGGVFVATNTTFVNNIAQGGQSNGVDNGSGHGGGLNPSNNGPTGTGTFGGGGTTGTGPGNSGGPGGFGGGGGDQIGGGQNGGAGGFGGGGGNLSGQGGFGGGTPFLDTTVRAGGGGGLGGAIFSNGGTVTITNSTFTSNSAIGGTGSRSGSGLGGAVFSRNGSVTISSSTLAGNTADQGGGAIFVVGDASSGSGYSSGNVTFSLDDSILANTANSASDFDSALLGGASRTFTGSNNLVRTNAGGGNGFTGGISSTADPLLGSLGSYGGPTRTLPLLPGSPAIDVSSTTITTDQRGLNRFGQADLGAFESQGFTIVASSGTPQSTLHGTAFANALVGSVTANNAGEPVDGGIVTFTPPGAGASAILSSSTATIAGGDASVSATANATLGSYTVGASAAGATSATFDLSNTESPSLIVTTVADVVDAFDDLTSLREAINYANSLAGADTVSFDPTLVAGGAATITLTGADDQTAGPSAFRITSDITIQGPTGNNGITISGGGSSSNYRFAYVPSSGSLTLSHLTIANFRHQGGAGGDRSGGAAGLGGAIFNQGSLSLLNSTLSGNVAEGGAGGGFAYYSGGGGGLGGNGNPLSGGTGGAPNGGLGGAAPQSGGFGGGGGGAAGADISGGTGGFGGGGGGGYAFGFGGAGGFGGGGGGSGTFGGNGGAAGFGGGVGSGASGAGMAGGGGAGMGGAVFNAGGFVIISNSTLVANAAIGAPGGSGIGGNGSGLGGAVFNLNGTITLTSNTLADNSVTAGGSGALAEGGALYSLGLSNVVEFNSGPNVGPADGTATANLTNNIFANSAAGASDIINDDSSGKAGVTGSNNLATQVGNLPTGVTSTTAAALNLGVLANNGGPTQTIALLPGSAAIAAGVATALTTDQRGSLRHANPDVGSYEGLRESLVVTTTDDEDDGTSDPFYGNGTSLREAINYANSHAGADTVTFDAKVFGTAQTITLNGTSIDFADSTGETTVAGTGAANLTVDADGLSRVFDIHGSSTVTIDGMTITGGSVSGDGGGIYNGGALTLTNSVVTGNAASSDGGGIYNYDGALVITNSTISGNYADSDGGGIYNYDGDVSVTASSITGNSADSDGGGIYSYYGTLVVTNSTISGNSAYDGGGIYNYGGDVTVTTSTVSGNTANGDGGGLYNYQGNFDVTNSTVSGNTADDDGGGIYNYDGNLTVTNSTISGNYSGSDGGGIYSYDGDLTVINSTVSGNAADSDGGGIYIYDGYLTLTNSTVSGNSAGNDGGGIYNSNASATISNSIVALNTASNSNDIDGDATVNFSLLSDTVGLNLGSGSGNNIVDTNPLLGVLGNYGGPTQTIPLLPGSPAINAGSSTIALDQRGEARVGGVDIGAFESQGFTFKAIGSGQSTKTNSAFANPVGVIVTANNAVEPVDGGVVQFAVPGSGASATLASSTVVISGGQAITTAKANGVAGKYAVDASAAGVNSGASITLSNTSIGIYAVGTGAGISSRVTVYDSATGALKFDFAPFDPAFLGGVRVATGDVNGDGVLDIICAAGPGGGPHVKVFNGTTGSQLPGPIGSFFAYAANFTGGVFVAAGDVDGDGKADVITGAGQGGGPHVIAFNGGTGSLLTSFYAYASNFLGGVSVAAGDIDGNGKADIITGAGAGGGPHVKAFDGQNVSLLRSFYAYDAAFTGGVFVASGDINGDGKDDIITGAGAGGGPHVKVFDGVNLSLLRSFFAYDAAFAGGVRVASSNFGDVTDGIITGAGPNGGPHVRVLNADLTDRASFFALPADSNYGVYVG